jgi:hypothetical protein
MLAKPLPQRIVGVQPPGDRLRVGQGRFLAFPSLAEVSKLSRSSYCPSLRPCSLAISERWFPQYSHFTERDTYPRHSSLMA